MRVASSVWHKIHVHVHSPIALCRLCPPPSLSLSPLPPPPPLPLHLSLPPFSLLYSFSSIHRSISSHHNCLSHHSTLSKHHLTDRYGIIGLNTTSRCCCWYRCGRGSTPHLGDCRGDNPPLRLRQTELREAGFLQDRGEQREGGIHGPLQCIITTNLVGTSDCPRNERGLPHALRRSKTKGVLFIAAAVSP